MKPGVNANPHIKFGWQAKLVKEPVFVVHSMADGPWVDSAAYEG
jgi:hypothetical protein